MAVDRSRGSNAQRPWALQACEGSYDLVEYPAEGQPLKVGRQNNDQRDQNRKYEHLGFERHARIVRPAKLTLR